MEMFVNTLAVSMLLLWVPGGMGYDDMTEMKNTLNQLVKQNKELQTQMSTITAGLTEMCRAVNIATCNCNQGDTGSSRDLDDTGELKLLYFVSQGEQNGTVQLTISFEATYDYSLEWMQTFQQANGMVRSSGLVTKTRLVNNRYLYQSDIKLHDIDITTNVLLRIYSLTYSATLHVNLTAVVVKGEQAIPEWKYKITNFPRQLVLPNDLTGEYNITITVARSFLEIEKKRNPGSPDLSPDIFFTLLNTTTEPHTIVELYEHDGIHVTPVDNGIGDIELVFTIPEEHLDNGGLFSCSVPHLGEGYLEVVRYGIVIEVIRENFQSIAPPGSLAIYKGVEKMYALSTVVSVTCFAMGNPLPDVTIFKERKGQLKELQTEVLIKDKITNIRSVTLNKSSIKGGSFYGSYVCHASNGNVTVQTKINIQRYQPIEFDEDKTGVIVNTTEKVVVSCKASGNPTPELEIRLGSNYGPNLLAADGNFTSKIKTKGGSSKVVITFSPPDPRMDVVYCYVLQKRVHYYANDTEIRIFPTDWSYDNWSFYESFRQSDFK